MSARPWTEAHRAEALRRTYEIAAEMNGDRFVLARAMDNADESECGWLAVLRDYANLDAARIDREVARVRALAEGRLVRETEAVARIRWANGEQSSLMDLVEARREVRARKVGNYLDWGVVVRVTRIRRAR